MHNVLFVLNLILTIMLDVYFAQAVEAHLISFTPEY